MYEFLKIYLTDLMRGKTYNFSISYSKESLVNILLDSKYCPPIRLY